MREIKSNRVLALLITIVLGISVNLSLFSVIALADTAMPVTTFGNLSSGEAKNIQTLCETINTDVHDKLEGYSTPTDAVKASGSTSAVFCSVTTTDSQTGEQSTTILRNSEDITVTVDLSIYKDCSSSLRASVLNGVLTDIQNDTNCSSITKTKFYNFIYGLDDSVSGLIRQLSDETDADFFTASYYLRPFSGVIGIVLGVLSILIISLLGLTTIIDIAFLTLPAVQVVLMPEKGKPSKFVSREAVATIEEASGGTENVSVMGIYLRKKGVQYVFLFICILYLTSGKIFDLIARLVDYFSGLVE